MKSGNGQYFYSNGDKYTGNFKGDKKEGPGCLEHLATQVSYTGNFIDDHKFGDCERYEFG